jgi:hypothetical protein
MLSVGLVIFQNGSDSVLFLIFIIFKRAWQYKLHIYKPVSSQESKAVAHVVYFASVFTNFLLVFETVPTV